MTTKPVSCAVCTGQDDLDGVVVAGQLIHLCSKHRAASEQYSLSEFSALADFFARPEMDRRRGGQRRTTERRQFPPRPEKRRHNMGRRADDPKES